MSAIYTTEITTHESFDAYKKAARWATKQAWGKAAEIVRRRWKNKARVSANHRSRREYPNGNYYYEPLHMVETLYKKTRDKGDRGILAFVRSKYGYSLWENYGTDRMGGSFAANKALKESIDDGSVIKALRGEMVKMPRSLPITKRVHKVVTSSPNFSSNLATYLGGA